MSHDEPAVGGGEGGRSRYEGARAVTPLRIQAYPRRHLVSVDDRMARLARSAVVRYEDFFIPSAPWDELHRRTTESIADGARRHR